MRLVTGSNGESVPELTISAILLLAEKAWKQDRAQLLETLLDAEASVDKKFKELREHDRLRGTRIPLSYMLLTDKGVEEVIETACTAVGKDPRAFVAGWSLLQRSNAAKQLVSFMYRDGDEPGEASGATAPT